MGEKKLETIGVVEGVTWNTLPPHGISGQTWTKWSPKTVQTPDPVPAPNSYRNRRSHFHSIRSPSGGNSKNSEHHEGALMNKHEAAHARRAKFLPLVRAQIEAGWSFGPACAKAGVPYDTAYSWARKYPEWRELGEMSNLLRRKGGDRG